MVGWDPVGVEGLSGSSSSFCDLLSGFNLGFLGLVGGTLALLREVRGDPDGVGGVEHATEARQDEEV